MPSFTDSAVSARQAHVLDITWTPPYDAEESGAPDLLALELDDGSVEPLTDAQHIAMISGCGGDYRMWPGALIEVGTEPTDNPEIPYRRILVVLEVCE